MSLLLCAYTAHSQVCVQGCQTEIDTKSPVAVTWPTPSEVGSTPQVLEVLGAWKQSKTFVDLPYDPGWVMLTLVGFRSISPLPPRVVGGGLDVANIVVRPRSIPGNLVHNSTLIIHTDGQAEITLSEPWLSGITFFYPQGGEWIPRVQGQRPPRGLPMACHFRFSFSDKTLTFELIPAAGDLAGINMSGLGADTKIFLKSCPVPELYPTFDLLFFPKP